MMTLGSEQHLLSAPKGAHISRNKLDIEEAEIAVISLFIMLL